VSFPLPLDQATCLFPLWYSDENFVYICNVFCLYHSSHSLSLFIWWAEYISKNKRKTIFTEQTFRAESSNRIYSRSVFSNVYNFPSFHEIYLGRNFPVKREKEISPSFLKMYAVYHWETSVGGGGGWRQTGKNDCRRILADDLHDLYSPTSVIRVMKQIRMWLVWERREVRKKFWCRNLREETTC
jgi:hypothetical protein